MMAQIKFRKMQHIHWLELGSLDFWVKLGFNNTGMFAI